MLLEAKFHVHKSQYDDGTVLLDGRVLKDINITDELIIVENVDIQYFNSYSDKNGRLLMDDYVMWAPVRINRIESSGEIWVNLPSGMSARLECECDYSEIDNMVLFGVC